MTSNALTCAHRGPAGCPQPTDLALPPAGAAWHGAEAYHFWLLAHRQLYGGDPEAALRTCLALRRYEDVLGAAPVYSLLALAAFYAGFYEQCSKVRAAWGWGGQRLSWLAGGQAGGLTGWLSGWLALLLVHGRLRTPLSAEMLSPFHATAHLDYPCNPTSLAARRPS
jgi:hypothetical protein